MKQEFLEETLQEISDRHIAEAAKLGMSPAEEVFIGDAAAPGDIYRPEKQTKKTDKKKNGRRSKCSWKPIIALATAAAVVAVIVFGGGDWWNVGRTPGESPVLRAHAVSEAVYPEMSPYPMGNFIKPNGEFDHESYEVVNNAWRQDRKEQRNQPEGYTEGADQFAAVTIPHFLRGAGTGNVIYSPLNVYMALAMAAEITDGETRAQLLALLGAEDIDALRWKAPAIWNAHYHRDGATSTVLASSLWLDERILYKEETVKNLAENYYASTYQGDMQTTEMGDALRAWLNQQTGGLLEDSIRNVKFSPETVLALASTVYLREKWSDEFSEKATKTDIFHAPTGDVECDFMYRQLDQNYYWADKFGGTFKTLKNGDCMWFILPDEGVSVDEVLGDSQLTEFLAAEEKWENSKRVVIYFHLPKFDISSDLDLKEGLTELGITELFISGKADFTPLSDDLPFAYVGEVSHAARVAVDEEGVTAAAYTEMPAPGAAPPPDEEIEFKLDRPFIFAITGHDGLPLFVGVVNQP
ncbi:MAG: hypothetical protein IIX65_09480 [Lachnospiraceae bacterium]|nr:hypothetical protein [Lachnospiraceae bacterium]